MNINGVINKVASRTVVSINGGGFSTINGIHRLGHDRWRTVWNGNHFAPPEPDSVLYLPGNPGFGSTTFDFSGQGNDGAITGATWRQLPTGLSYLDFDGSSGYVNCSNDSSLNFTGNFTVKMWIKPGALSASDYLLACRGLANTDGWYVLHDSTNQWKVKIQTNQSGAVTAALSNANFFVTDTWVHAVLVRNGTSGLIYKNGVDDTASSDSMANAITSTRNLYIGAYDTTGNKWLGGIALVELYGIVWDAAQVQSSFSRERHLFGV